MNNLDTIRAFAGLQTKQNTAAHSKPIKNGEPYLAALKALAQSSEWLQDPALTEQVVSRLESIEPQSPEARAQTAAIYMKLITQNGQQKPIRLNTVQIKISKQETVDLPKAMLMAESPVLQRLLSKTANQPIDLSGKASKENLTHLTTHLATGETSFVTDENAVELLLLAKEFELTELAMTCLEHLLGPTASGLKQTSSQQPVSDAENKLRELLNEARANSIVISRAEDGIAHIKMEDGSKEEQWDCLRKLHDYFPVRHLELTDSKNLECLLAFSKHNPNIVSLSLGRSLNVSDAYLEQLSQNLSSLRSFSIQFAPIKALPLAICERATNLHCYGCRSLKRINTDNALTLNCGYCDALTSLFAPNVTTLDCRSCYELTSLHTPNVITLSCKGCSALKSISAPRAVTLKCAYCDALKSLDAAMVVTLDCRMCRSLTRINAPNALTLRCHACPDLADISAPNVISLHCDNCPTLTCISAPKAEMIECSSCVALTSISAPIAVTLNCHNCYILKSISAPRAQTIDCHRCHALADIEADQVVTLDCSSCYTLKSINAPHVVTLNCQICNTLENISAPKAEKLDCSICRALTEINAENTLMLTCNECSKLTKINAPNAVTLDCNNCSLLNSIRAPNAVVFHCRHCPVLININAPRAKILDCNKCNTLISLSAPHATSVDYSYCPALKSINVSKALALDCRGCNNLTSTVRLKLFNVVRRNIILTCYKNTEKLIEHLSVHVKKANTAYGLDVAAEFPIKQWFTDTQQLNIPVDFASENEKRECEKKIANFYKRLITYAANESTLQGVDLGWFNDLRKLDSPQQQMSRVIWLGSLLACTTPDENPLADREAFPTLKAIGNLGDPFLQEGATRALFSMYETEASGRTNAWITLREKRSDHQLLLCLFFARSTIDMDLANRLLDDLNTRYYRDFKLLGPILEMTCLLTAEHSLTDVEQEEMLRLILKAPEKGPREKTKQHAQQLKKFRAEQPMWVNACRDLLLFQKPSRLKNLKDENDLLNRHKRTCQAVFGVKEELLHTFVNTFKSQRYPNGLFTYAARLQTLPEIERTVSTELLAKFVNGVLERGFPDNRYDLSNNVHLKIVFDGSAELFTKWKEPLEIDLEQTESLHQDPVIAPRDAVQDLMKRAIANMHLGPIQARFYQTLEATLESNDPEETLKNITLVEKRLKETRVLLKTALGKNRALLKEELSHLQIETLCLKALDPRAGITERVELLKTLLVKLPEGIEFRNDVSGMLDVLNPSKSSQAKWVKIQTSESWEDFLLMGTEVNNSCQRIDGDPHFNKCLLAYILDGKNKLMIVRDSTGKIAARSVLRILWNSKEKRPVLFMEQIYIAKADPTLDRLIMDGCVEKAKRMGLPLVASKANFPTGASYKGQLSALGGPAPFEYVDALSGIQVDGRFTLSTSTIIYTPDAE